MRRSAVLRMQACRCGVVSSDHMHRGSGLCMTHCCARNPIEQGQINIHPLMAPPLACLGRSRGRPTDQGSRTASVSCGKGPGAHS